MFIFFWFFCHTGLVTAIYTGLWCFNLAANSNNLIIILKSKNSFVSSFYISSYVLNLLMSVWSACSFRLPSLCLLLGYAVLQITLNNEICTLSTCPSLTVVLLIVCFFLLGVFCSLVCHCQFFIAGRGGNSDADNMLLCFVFWPI